MTHPPLMEITRKMLLDAGGWQAMKMAQVLVTSGRVAEACYDPPVLRGTVQEGSTSYRAGLKIQSATRIENLCSCRESRQWGRICAHSLAVGLTHLEPPTNVPTPIKGVGPVHPLSSGELLIVIEAKQPDFRLHLILPPSLANGEAVGEVMVVAEIERGKKRMSLSSVDPRISMRCEPLDAAAIQLLYAFAGQKLPGMAIFSAQEFAQFASALGAHSRATFGKTQPANLSALAQKWSSSQVEVKTVEEQRDTQSRSSFVLELEGSLNHLAAKLAILRRDTPFPITPSTNLAAGSPEAQAVQRLEQLGFSAAPRGKEWAMQGEMAIVRFFADALPALQQAWKVTLGPRFTNITAEIERIAPRIAIRDAGERWFDLDVSLASQDGGHISNEEVQRLLRSGQHWMRKKNGKLAVFDGALLEEFQAALAQSAPQQARAGEYRVERQHALHLNGVLGQGAVVNESENWRAWIDKATHPGKVSAVSLGDFEQILRPYQKQGVYWMHFLAQHQLGGILADEMGLGKTVQTLAFLVAARATTASPSLVVCPSSLVFNWKQEAARFAPALRTVQYEGGERTDLAASDLIITSYGLLRRNADRLSKIHFDTIILDEAQHIKNASTQNARYASSLRANSRFALTGTPLENSLMDLWSLMNFAIPNYLGEQKQFAEQYIQNTDSVAASASPKSNGLAARIAPYLLRRRKKELLKELPAKTIQILSATMTVKQANWHATLVSHAQQELVALHGKANNKLKVFTILMRLRQVACDVRLIDPQLAPDAESASGKLKLLEELLAEIIDANRRVLIFSQFVGMLQLISQQLKQNGIAFSYLDGSTANREQVVNGFKSDSSIPVFLISLKAGGFGLNLTEADTVIHFDPWWNPAVEAQASDRIHRIGQTQAVTIYKLISVGSIEEKMLKLQERKSNTLSAILEVTQAAEKLTFDEIRSLVE